MSSLNLARFIMFVYGAENENNIHAWLDFGVGPHVWPFRRADHDLAILEFMAGMQWIESGCVMMCSMRTGGPHNAQQFSPKLRHIFCRKLGNKVAPSSKLPDAKSHALRSMFHTVLVLAKNVLGWNHSNTQHRKQVAGEFAAFAEAGGSIEIWLDWQSRWVVLL